MRFGGAPSKTSIWQIIVAVCGQRRHRRGSLRYLKTDLNVQRFERRVPGIQPLLGCRSTKQRHNVIQRCNRSSVKFMTDHKRINRKSASRNRKCMYRVRKNKMRHSRTINNVIQWIGRQLRRQRCGSRDKYSARKVSYVFLKLT